MTLVKNVEGSSKYDPPRGYSSWKEYWESRKRRKFSFCSCTSCRNRAEDGGHVRKLYNTSNMYIIPLCSRHNNPSNTDAYSVRDEDLLAI